MDQRLHVVGLGGSFSTPSASLQALDEVLASAASAGATTERFDIPGLELPLFGSGGDVVPLTATRLAEAVGRADALVWSSPMYHGTVSASFKNALDWLQLLATNDPPYLSGKPVGLVATAAGTQALQAINTMEFVVRALRGWAVPLTVPIARAHDVFGADGRPVDPVVAAALQALGRELVFAAGRFAA